MNNFIISFLLILISVNVSADYKVNEKSDGGQVVNIPEKSCELDVSSLPNGVYTVCGHDGENLVVGGVAFYVEPSIPSEAFSCLVDYANHSQAMAIAKFEGVKVYTPYDSYKPVARNAGNYNWALGEARYIESTGIYDNGHTDMYLGYLNDGSSGYVQYFNRGTVEELLPPYDNGTYAQTRYKPDYSKPVTNLVASRACRIEPS